MAVNLSPVGGVAAQFFTNTGAVLSGGKLYTYAAGTTTPLTTYTTSAGNVARTNPIVLDSAGRVSSGGEIWVTVGVNYKFVLNDSNDVLIGTYDNVPTQANTDASLVAYTPAGTGAVTTTVQAKLRQTVSVKDFGATGDGATDDTTAINTAVTYLNTLGGGGLFFPQGVYIISAPINLRSGIDYYGLGWNSIVKQKSGITATNLFGEASPASATSNIIIRDLAIDGNRGSVSFPVDDGDGNAIRLNQTSYSRLFNLYIHDTVFNAISVYNLSNDNIISDCQIADIGKSGVPPGAFTFNGVFFEAGSNRNKLLSCRISSTGQYGIWVGARDADNLDNLIHGNWIASTYSDGIRVGDDATTNQSSRTQISNNYVIGAGDLGIRIFHSAGGAINQTLICNNNVSLNVNGGIYAQTGAYKTLISSNICVSNGGYGVSAAGEDTTATGNQLFSNTTGQLQLLGTRPVDLWNTTTTVGSPYTTQKIISGIGFSASVGSGSSSTLELDQSGIRKWTVQNTATTGLLDVLFGTTTALSVQNAPTDGNVGLALYRNVSGTLTLQQVSMGAADSGGVGFKLLRVAN